MIFTFISGIISLIIGFIWYIQFFEGIAERGWREIAVIHTNIAMNGSIFIVGGLILLAIGFRLYYLKTNNEKLSSIQKFQNIGNNFENTVGKKEQKINESKFLQTEYRGEKDITNGNNWICGKCGTVNELFLPCCKKCEKEFTG